MRQLHSPLKILPVNLCDIFSTARLAVRILVSKVTAVSLSKVADSQLKSRFAWTYRILCISVAFLAGIGELVEK